MPRLKHRPAPVPRSRHPVQAEQMEHAVILRCEHGGRELLTPQECRDLAASLLVRAEEAEAYQDPKRGPWGRG